jgi:hypothetical protein
VTGFSAPTGCREARSPRPDRRGVGDDDGRLRLTAEGEPRLVVVGGPGTLGRVRGDALDIHDDDLTALHLTEKDLLRELVLDLALDRPAMPGAAVADGREGLLDRSPVLAPAP